MDGSTRIASFKKLTEPVWLVLGLLLIDNFTSLSVHFMIVNISTKIQDKISPKAGIFCIYLGFNNICKEEQLLSKPKTCNKSNVAHLKFAFLTSHYIP